MSMSEFRPTPESINQQNIENMRLTSELSSNVSRMLTTDKATFTDGVLFDANGDEVDDPARATAVGSIGYRVVEHDGAPVALRAADYRAEPRGLYQPPAITRTQIIFTASPTPSVEARHYLQVTAVEKTNSLGHKLPVGTVAHYLVRAEDGYSRQTIESGKQARLLGRALAITQKLA